MHREFCGWCADKAKRDAELAAANINLSSVMKRQQKLEAERDALRKSVASFEKEEDRLEGMIMDLQDKRAKCSAERDALMMMAERYFIALVQVSEKPCVEVTTKDLRKIAEAALKEKP
jgi:septal ring factor EnvC (AmiA/AmiB activator)